MTPSQAVNVLAHIAAYQASKYVHPLTCGNNSNHEPLHPIAVRNDDATWRVELRCDDCGYIQTYIPEFLTQGW